MMSTIEESDSENCDRRPLIPHGGPHNSQGEEPGNEPWHWMQARHVLVILGFMGFFNVYCLRVNLSVALVAMVTSPNKTTGTNDSMSECKAPSNVTSYTGNTGEFYWDERTQGLILGSFGWGYIVTQVPGGYFAARFGAKVLLGLGILCTSVLTLLTPLVARMSLNGLLALRVIEGLGEGVTYPAMHAMWGNWAPVWERTKLAGITYSGALLGTVVAMPISGLLCDSTFLGGWPSVFYVFGTMGCLWVLLWFCMAHETPADHPRISKSEREYIESSIGKKEVLRTPWIEILTCGPLWGIAIASIASNFGSYIYLTSLPTYMQRVLKFDIKADGFLSALPYLSAWLMMTFASYMADVLRSRNYLSTLNTRRLMSCIGLLIPAGLLSAVGYVGCDHIWAVSLLTLSLGVNAFGSGGYAVNHLDIAPKFAGVMMGITNGLGNIPSFVAPIVVGYITGNNETVDGWRQVFFLAAGIYALGAIVYILLAKGNEMAWARERPRTDSAVSGETASIQHQGAPPYYNQEIVIPPPPSYEES